MPEQHNEPSAGVPLVGVDQRGEVVISLIRSQVRATTAVELPNKDSAMELHSAQYK